MMKKKLFTLLTLLCTIVGGVKATQVTAIWDWQNSIPSSITETNIQTSGGSAVVGTLYGTVASNVDGINLGVYAAEAGTNIKLQYGNNGNGYAQFNQNTAIRVPVTSTSQIVTVVSYPGQYYFKVGGIAATGNTTNHTVTIDERTQGYVEIVATSTAYLYSITLSTFKDISINLTTWSEGISTSGSPTTAYVTVGEGGTASYVTAPPSTYDATLTGYFHGNTYGWQNMTASVPVPGYVKITYGANDFGGNVSITNTNGTEVATLNNYNSTGKWSTSNSGLVATALYTDSEPTTLNFSSCPYVGYFAIEKMTDEEISALSSNYTLTYYDTDGTTELGTQVVAANQTITSFSYSESDCTVASGKAFRGWFATASGGQKYTTSAIVTGDMSLYAIATDIEASSDDAEYTFDLGNQYFYAEDHEAFNPTGGAWHDGQHGWVFSNGNTIDLLVGAKAVISVGICKYSNSDTKINVKKGDEILAVIDGYSATDGALVSYDYVGTAGTLTLEIESTGSVYIHNVKIVNYNSSSYTKHGQWYMVNAASADGFKQALSVVNGTNGSTSAARSFIFLPNGEYDLGTATLTAISGHNISIIGESRDGVIIKNRPTAEGISVTATLYNTGTNNYLQDLTLDCVAPWDGTAGAERGVCLQDKGNQTICKNVYLKGLQDTYYSNNSSGQFYFEDGKIEGTVDYLCGNGDVYFNRVTLYNTSSANRSGGDVIAAPNTKYSFGYIFNNCTIDGVSGQAGNYYLGRPWAENGTKCLYVNTTMQQIPVAAGWQEWDTHTVAQYAEYNSVNGSGSAVDVSGRLTTIGSTNNPVITAAEAATYMPEQIFTGSWLPQNLTAQLDAPTVSVSGTTASWDAVTGAAAYALYKDDVLVGITTDTEYTVDGSGTYTLRVANSMGGFGTVTGTTPTVSPTIGATGYATFSCSHALDFSSASGVKAYVATAISDGKLMMTKVTGAVPANTGLFLQKDGEGAISIPVVPTATAPATNLLKPSVDKTVVAASTEGAYHYVFALQGGSVGFYNLINPTNIPAGKAYLETTVAVSSPVLMFDIEGTTGISEKVTVNNDEIATSPVYNLNGQRVEKPAKGLYIVNGKKVIVK